MKSGRLVATLLAALTVAAITACSSAPGARHADVIVVGAGLAGLAAALEASAGGARVILIDANSVGGGHAVKAGGFALVDTALQRDKGISDSPDLAVADWIRRGVDPDIYWARRYAEQSATEVYDWLTANGVKFKLVLPTADDRVARFHFTAGTAVHAAVPLLRKVIFNTNIETLWNTRAIALARSGGRINGVKVRDERSGAEQVLRSNAVILATGGLQNDLAQVLANWPTDLPKPERVLRGAGQFATGDGYRLARWAGAELRDLDRQVIFYNGVPDPRDASGSRGLVAQNPRAIWVDASGRRFINEASDGRSVTETLQTTAASGYWMIFDAAGAKRFSVRDATWLNRATLRSDILDNPRIVKQARSIKELSRKTGIPEHGLRTTLQTWNRMVEFEEDFQFGRFDKGSMRNIEALRTPPFYAVRTWPLTRKNMGGPAIDLHGQVVTAEQTPIAGLYAAGELTGVAGINGSYGGAGTFLGPAVFTGRIAGKAAALDAGKATTYSRPRASRATTSPTPGASGYWHFDKAHQLVSERGLECATCHSNDNPMQPASARGVMLARLQSCVVCH